MELQTEEVIEYYKLSLMVGVLKIRRLIEMQIDPSSPGFKG